MQLRLPNTFTIIFTLIFIMAVATWLLPSGEFDRKYNEEAGKDLVVAGTYHKVEKNPQGLIAVFGSFSKGIVDAAEVISYVLIVGGAYGVILKTGAMDAGLKRVIQIFQGRSSLLIIIVMFLFSVGGTTTGMWEETLPFYLILIPLMIRSGYDPIVGVAIAIVGAGTGVMASIVNPFATGIASGIAEISIKEGSNLRIAFWFISVFISISYVLFYANKVKKNPEKSIMHKQRDQYLASFANVHNNQEDVYFTFRRKLIVIAFLSMIVFMMYSILQLGWWIPEMTFLFLAVALFSAVVGKISESKFWEYFVEGSKDLLGAALIIGIARGILIVAKDGVILDTILLYCANAMASVPSYGFLIINEIIQIMIAIFVPSSSAHAALTIPIMAPLADLMNVPRSSIVSSYQFASGLANLITPTAGVLIAALSMGKVAWGQWVKFIFPLLVIHFLVSIVIVILHLYL